MKKFLLVLLVFGMAGIVNAATTITDNFNSYDTSGGNVGLNDTGIWFTGGSLSVVAAAPGAGVDGSQGVTSSGTVASLSAGIYKDSPVTHVKWTQLAVGDYMTISGAYESSSSKPFDDDRLGMINDWDTTSSGRILGAQMESDTGYIEGYWDSDTANDIRVPIVALPATVYNDWYNFSVTITKLGDYRAQFDVVLAELNGTVLAAGSLDTGTLAAGDQPAQKYFTDDQLSGSSEDPSMGGLWPMFKNNSNSSTGFDNYSYTLVPEPMTLSLLGLGGLALLRRRRA